jgi:capsular polysaccharide biosynthesis protein
MSDTLAWRDLTTRTLRRWWIVLALALVGAAMGVVATASFAQVYRAEGTVLVGPINSTITRSTTLRASESLATFYADMARREVVLQPVRDRLGLPLSVDALRESVSARVPDQNPRVVTVTVQSDDKRTARRIASTIVDELVSLSPAPAGVTQPVFVTEQASALETTIQSTEDDVDTLQTSLAATTDASSRADLERAIAVKQQFLTDSRQTYVELVSLEPDSDAGGLTILDSVVDVSTGRAGPVIGAVVGGGVGAVLGVVVVWLLARRRRPQEPLVAHETIQPPAPSTVNVFVRPLSGVGRNGSSGIPRRPSPAGSSRAKRSTNGTSGR